MITLVDMINFVHNSLYVQYGNVNVLLHGEIMILVVVMHGSWTTIADVCMYAE